METNHKFEPQINPEELSMGCLNCSSAALVAPMDMLLAVGFGNCYVTKGDEIVYSEFDVEDENYWTIQDAENAALEAPDLDWRVVKNGPMHGETFQRQGEGKWVCIESNRGFA